jgi:hypothetical protein
LATTNGGKRDPGPIRLNLEFLICSFIMAAANASDRGQRAAILASPLSELTGFNLTVDCLSPGCAP